MTTSVDLLPASRRAVPGLGLARPMVTLLPSIYQQDDFTVRWLAGFDEVLAPVQSVLDCFDAYLDPALSPSDFLGWVGSWLGAVIDDDMTLADRRALVASVVEIYGQRGTPEGIRRLLELSLPVTCEIVEGGGCAPSALPGAALPGTSAGAFVVRVRPGARASAVHPDATGEDNVRADYMRADDTGTDALRADEPLTDHQRRRVVMLVEASRPAHLPAVVEFVGGSEPVAPAPAAPVPAQPAPTTSTEE